VTRSAPPALAGVVVVVARDDAPDDDVSAALMAAGAVVVPLPLMAIVVDDGAGAALRAALDRRPDAVALTSRHAVGPFAAAWRASPHVPARAGFVVGVVGARTAEAARSAGLRVDVEGDAGGLQLAQGLIDRGVGRVLFPRARDAHDALVVRLREAGVVVEDVVVYRSAVRPDVTRAVRAAWAAASRPRALVITSPQRARLVVQEGIPADVVRVALGATTAAALVQQGDRVDAVAARPRPDAVVEAVCSGMLTA
jgi:uroporphyrinogen-III synthase